MSEEIIQATERLRNVLQGMAEDLCEKCHTILETEIEETHSKALKDSEVEPCDDTISREAAIYELKKYFSDDGMKDTEYGAYWHHVHVIEVLKSMPSVTPKQRTGHWIEEDGYDGDTYYDCSVCGESWATIEGTPWDNGMKYCPNCGADMREETNHE